MYTAKVLGSNFKALLAAVTKYPSVGTFVGSDIVSLTVHAGYIQATMFGTVLARVRVKAEGDIPLFGVDERALSSFASHCRVNSEVIITVDEKHSRFRRGRTEITTPLSKGQEYVFLKSKTGIKLTWEAAKDLGYLGAIAMSDSSKPELNAVLLQNNHAVACGQMAAAMLDCTVTKHRTALPLPLIKSLNQDDTIYCGANDTVLKQGIAEYRMPTPVIAQDKFPYDTVLRYGSTEVEVIATVPGTRLKSALEECAACIGNVSRLEVVVGLRFTPGRVEVSALNGGVKFRRVLAVTGKNEAELNVPMTEAVAAAMLLENKKVTICKGKNNETFLKFGNGWVLFPSWGNTASKKGK